MVRGLLTCLIWSAALSAQAQVPPGESQRIGPPGAHSDGLAEMVREMLAATPPDGSPPARYLSPELQKRGEKHPILAPGGFWRETPAEGRLNVWVLNISGSFDGRPPYASVSVSRGDWWGRRLTFIMRDGFWMLDGLCRYDRDADPPASDVC